MRVLLVLISIVLPLWLSGCEDAIGPGGSCRSEMNDLRRQRGQPDSHDRDVRSGDFTEQWVYHSRQGQPGRVYTFRWGVSYDGCVVDSGPLSTLEPGAEPLPVRAPGDER